MKRSKQVNGFVPFACFLFKGNLVAKLLEEVESLGAKVERDEVKVESSEAKVEASRGNVERIT
ncbi:hypothetical protein B857_02827 [Solibacillus isronensis B3W22]|uniref:Uncharacterized protein n=1 Tax=Solibacillus isronensis B3W22 TaxID=1224748 RepID=K1L123_9BACL|nr:hypothetical protein [Solibacillus isronensis]AMO84385.1 hypothetical protein SOLI23_02035 [Solibacillus silvestris]EKB44373.1 hypothetical protein B857_02827 [Solibacillus isronensis B3W22]